MVLVATLFLTSCYKPWHKIEGNGDVITETRVVGSFERVYNSGIFDVYIIQADYREVVMEAESNLLPFIRTKTSGNNLTIDTRDNLKPSRPINVYVYTPDITRAELSGSGMIYSDSLKVNNLSVRLSGSGSIDMAVRGNDVECDISGSGSCRMQVEADKLKANISGSGEMEFYGYANRADYKISGSGSIHSYDLPVDDCYTTTSGSGDMYVNVYNYLDVTISGSGNVYYLGTPQITTHISGSGNVIHP